MTPRHADEIAKELGGTQDVLGLLEGDGVEGHADGGLAVAVDDADAVDGKSKVCLLYTSPSPRDGLLSRMPSSA